MELILEEFHVHLTSSDALIFLVHRQVKQLHPEVFFPVDLDLSPHSSFELGAQLSDRQFLVVRQERCEVANRHCLAHFVDHPRKILRPLPHCLYHFEWQLENDSVCLGDKSVLDNW